MKKIYSIITALVIWGSIVTMVPVQALQQDIPADNVFKSGLEKVEDHLANDITGTDDLVTEIISLINYLLGFLMLACVIVVIYSGVTLIFSMGNEEKMKKMRKIITNVVIGMIIIALSWVIVSFVFDLIKAGSNSNQTTTTATTSGNSSVQSNSQTSSSVDSSSSVSSTTSFSAPVTAKVSEKVSFDASALKGTKWVWNFGDNYKGFEETMKHIYRLKGVYTVTLKVTDNNQEDKMYSQTITITE